MEANIKKTLTRLITLALLLVSISLPLGAYNNLTIIRGTVGAVGVVLDDDGDPILAEYNASGNYVRDVSVPGGTETNDLIIYSGEAYRGLYTAAQDLLQTYPGARIMSKSQYDSQSFRTHTQTPQVIRKPRLIDPDTKSVLLIDERQMLVTNPPYEGFILHEFPVDLSPGVGQNLPSNIVSLLINKQGGIIFRSSNDIAYKIDIFERDGDTKILDEDGFFITTFPLDMVAVTAGDMDIMPMGGAVTDEKGRYVMPYTIPPCPGFFYQAKVPIIAMTPLSNFNPKSDGSTSYNPALFWDWATCIGYGDVPIGFSLQALNAQITAMGIVASMGTPVHNLNLNFSTMQLAAIGTLLQVELSDTTQYQSDDTPIDPLAVGKYNFDFDGDGTTDIIRINAQDSTKLDIYLGDNNPDNNPDAVPDLTRLADYDLLQQLNDQGLLKTISKADLEDTDIYIYRNSTSQLIGQMEGLVERDNREEDDILLAGSNNNSPMLYKGVHEDESIATFGFASLLLGASSFDLISGLEITDSSNRRPWMSPQDGSATSFANDRQPDFMRPGEIVKIVAINRATGYMGSADARLQSNYIQLETPIQLGPPNLKVIATRTYKDQAGLTKDEQHDNQLIGSEGAGLTSDQYIKIQTIWLDHKGNPLPENLPGYTGRVAISTGSQTEDFSGNFEIKPGYQTELVQLNNAADLTTQHFYVQVIGENYDGNPSFESPGAGPGKLQTRPKKYTPIKVPVYNELATQEAQQALIKATQDGVQNLPDEVQPVYHWVYRPEMQFSVYDFKVNEIRQEIAQNEFVDIYAAGADDSDATVPVLSSDYDITDILYELTGKDSDQLLDLFGPDRELIIAIGEQEANVTATLNQQGNIEFENLDHLGQLAVEDYLSIRLYQNNDAFNVLWEFAFEYVYIEPTTIGYENQTDDTYYITADDPYVELKAGITGYAYRAEEDKYNANFNWEASGDGSFTEPMQSTTDYEYGLFDNKLTMPTTKGAKADISATLGDTSQGLPVKWKTVEVLAGKTSRIEVSQSGQAIAMEQGDIRLDFTLYDTYNNLVEDGTELTLDFSDSLLLKEQELSTTDGKAYVILSGGEYQVPDTIVTVTAESVIKETHINVQPLDIVLTADTTALSKTETTTVSATVTTQDGNPVSGVPVTLSATKGVFAEQALTTDASGIVTTRFTAGLNEVNDSWVAQVGYAAATELAYSVTSSGSNSINAEDAILVADTVGAGVVDYDAYGVNVSLDYETEGNVTFRGEIGDTITIGDMADPNLEPVLSLPLNDIDYQGLQGQFLDDHGANHAYINRGQFTNPDDDISIVNDHPLGAGRSAHFQQASKVSIEQNGLFDIADSHGFRLDIKPLGNGDIVSYNKDALKLSFNNNTLTLRTVTTDGAFSVSAADIPSGQWHRVAANVQGNQLNLYVDGTTYSQAITGTITQGTPMIIASRVIQIGGLEAIIRGFRVYHYDSDPLISFADGNSSATLTSTAETLVIKSLGNLGKQISGSQLNTARVALISGSERNYASLLTREGYKEIAQNYLYTVSPQTPIAGISNPIPGLIPSAYAWSWSGLWEGVKTTVGFLIPYEDFITIGQQLMYLVNQDWENFDPTTLAFASLGAATIIPVAKPLKVVLGPLKKVVDGMRHFPAARHFAGMIGTAVKAGITGKTEKIEALLPFILIAIELYDDPEVFTFIMNAVESEDDFWVWVNYVAEMVNLEGGIDLVSYGANDDRVMAVTNPLPWAIPNAQAINISSVIRIGAKIAEQVKKLAAKIPANKAVSVVKALKVLFKEPSLLKIVLKSGRAIQYFAYLGVAKIRYFIQNSRNWRVNRWFVLFSLAFLAEELEAGRLDNLPNDGAGLLGVLSKVFSKNENDSAGALFQLSQLAYYHAKSRIDSSQPKLLAIEAYRPSYVVVNREIPPGAKPYKRRVDIIVEGPDGSGEEWIEVKSLAKSSFNSGFSNTPFTARNTKYKEFFHDLRLNKNIITQDSVYQGKILEDEDSRVNEQYTWYFHKFSRGRGIPPTTREETKARDKLCEKPNVARSFAKYNLAGSLAVTEAQCNATKSLRIKLRDTESYITEIIGGLVAQNVVDAQGFIDMINSIPQSSEWW